MMGRRARRLAPLLLLAAAFALAGILLAGLAGLPGMPGAILTPPPASAAHTPTITPSITSTAPGGDSVYSTGDTITINTAWSDCVASVSNAELTIGLGSGPVTAAATGDTTNVTTLVFSYTVLAADLDQDGITVGTGALSGTYNIYTGSACTGANHAAAAATLTNALASAQSSHAVNTTDYDTDDDGLIEIGTGVTGLNQLNAIRHNVNGNGTSIYRSSDGFTTLSQAQSATAYNNAFANSKTNGPNARGCPASGCRGYELTGNLTFDINDDGTVNAADGHSWPGEFLAIGNWPTTWSTTFNGNGHTISHVNPHAPQPYSGLFARMGSSGHITNLGVINSHEGRNDRAFYSLLVGALRGGTISNSWSTGSLESTGSTSHISVGGLAGEMTAGTIRNSWSSATVTCAPGSQYCSGGGLVGNMSGGTIVASYATGAVSGGCKFGADASVIGGLVGRQDNGWIVASYATGAVSSTKTVVAGGLVGAQRGGSISASYSAGAVTGSGAGNTTAQCGGGPTPFNSTDASIIGGLTAHRPAVRWNVGDNNPQFTGPGTIYNSYWDTTASGVAPTANSRGAGHTTADLQTPTDYTGIYSAWNIGIDGSLAEPWHFGTASQYPRPKYGRTITQLRDFYGETPPAATVDYDGNDNSLIDITTLAQLDAVRYDLDGSGADGLTGNALLNYQLAFPGALDGMGCPDGPDADSDPGDCAGYELRADLDFAGSQWTEIGGGGLGPVNGHSGGPGQGWRPIGGGGGIAAAGDYTGDFKGNGHTIRNLYINARNLTQTGLFQTLKDGEYDGIGLVDAEVSVAYDSTGTEVSVGALAGVVDADLRTSYATGRVAYQGSGSAAHARVGGLIGATANKTQASEGLDFAGLWSGVIVVSDSASTETAVGHDYAGGLIGELQGHSSLWASYATGHRAAPSGRTRLSGLVGSAASTASIARSYAAGTLHLGAAVDATDNFAVPLDGGGNSGVVSASYYDTDTLGTFTGVSGAAKTTAELQTPTAYGATASDDFYQWNLDVDDADADGDTATGTDDPWDFGTDSQYPVLKFGYDAGARTYQRSAVAYDPAAAGHDADKDGLIEIANLAQLNAVRWDLNADGWASTAGRTTYRTAFPNSEFGMGCPVAGCTGYELTANLDFDTSGDDDVADAPYASWTPIGVNGAGAATAYTGVFEGNRHTISNLRISLSTSTDDGGSYVGLFGDSSGAIRNVGLVNPSISNTRTGGGTFSRTAALVGRNNTGGTIRNSWVDGGTVTVSDSTTTNPLTACLVAYSDGAISDSWTSCAISATSAGSGSSIGNFAGGILAFGARGGSIAGSHATGAVTLSGNTNVNAGGLAGRARANITSSYATGAVTSNSTLAAGQAGGLVGLFSDGDIKASYARGNVSAAGAIRVGGLVGKAELGSSNVIQAAYASGTVSRTATSGGGNVGGLVGQLAANPAGRTNVVQAAYAVGAVSNADTTTPGAAGGLISDLDTVTAPVSNSYWNNEASGTNQASSAGGGTGATGANMQTPTGYDSTPVDYSGWNLNLDGAGSGDDPWDFGTNAQYPILQYGHDAISIARQRGLAVGGVDYDANDNNLIDIATLDNLNAVRYDLDGDGRSTGADAVGYLAGFPNLTRGMGCPDGCQGYELTAHLDFDTNGDGDVTSADDYESWAPIGQGLNAFTYRARFVGNGYTIANLTINNSTVMSGLFGQTGDSAVISGVGLPNVNITSTSRAGALAGTLRGTAYANWSSGSVASSSYAGGLVGAVTVGDADKEAVLSASWSSATVTGSGSVAVGGLVGRVWDTVNYSYATGVVTNSGSGGAGGVIGSVDTGAAVIAATYWDNESSGISTASTITGVTGQSTSNLKMPTEYGTGIYAAWNVDVDGDGNVDDPWDFGTASQYPVLKQGRSLAWQGRGGFAYTQNNAAATTLAVTEEAADGAAFGVTLAVAPDADITLTIESPGDDAVTLDGPDAGAVFSDSETLTFTAANWDTPQTVTLKAATGDDDLVDEMSTLTLTAADAGSDKSGYAGLMGTVDVTVNDDDTAAIVLTKNSQPITALDVIEQGTAVTYDVALSNLPGANVTVDVRSGDTDIANGR